MICSSKCFDAVKFSSYSSSQTETIECMQTFEETYDSDEKIFTVETSSNRQNDRVYANVNAKRDVSPIRLLFQIVHLPAE